MDKRTHRATYWLTWLVVTTQILALITTATVAAIQPTPQMMRAAAQQAGFAGDHWEWVTGISERLTQVGQRLWGEPAAAQAATTYGNPVPLLSTTHSATITTGRTGLCTIINCFITNSGNVVDANTANVGNINIPLGLAGGIYFSVKSTTIFPAGDRAGFLIDNGGGLIDLSLFSAFSLTTYKAGVQQENVSSAALLDVSLFGGANSNAVSFVTTKDFDEVRLTAGSLVGALLNLDVFYAFMQPAIPSAAPGGVTANLAAWYKADGTVSTTQWNDESPRSRHMLAAGDGTAARMPTLDATPGTANNFNPRVAFLSNADGNRKWTMTASGNNVFATTTTPGTIFNVSSFPDETVYDVPQMYAFEDDDPGLNLVTDRNAANDIRVIFQRDNGGTGSAGWDFVVPGVSQTQPLLTAHAWNYAAGGNTFTFNGYDYTPSSNPFIGATSPRYIFGAELTSGGGEAHSGYTSENIVYSVDWPANSNERKRINSYLALKYGITLLGTGTLAGGSADATFGGTADYLDSASTVIWSGTTSNSSYHNNVAGIGRDDASALQQKQSTSVNDGFQPVIGLGAIAASNAANASTFSADNSFLVWGDNNQAISYGVSYTPTTFIPVASYFHMNRVWKVQETGTITNVVVQATGVDHLLVSSDPTFATGVTEIDMTSGSATVDFADGQYFTFGADLKAPGGVAVGDMVFWYKADAISGSNNGDRLANWETSRGEYGPVTQSNATLQPLYYSSDPTKLVNFNPVVYFGDASAYKYLSNANRFLPSNSAYAVFGALQNERASTAWQNIFAMSQQCDVAEMTLYPASNRWFFEKPGGYYVTEGNNNVNGPGGNAFGPSGGLHATYNGSTYVDNIGVQPQVFGISDAAYTGSGSAGLQTTGYVDGYKTFNSSASDGAYRATSGTAQYFAGLTIGWGTCDTGEYIQGPLPELFAYNRTLTDAEVQKINTYVALKYGITLGQGGAGASTHINKNHNNYNYVSATGVIIWDATANAAYNANIAGIGRDDRSGLLQKQAKSAGTNAVVTIYNGDQTAGLPVSNSANTTGFSTDGSFLIWGHNGQTASYGVSYSPTSFTPAAGYFHMNRVWKVQETGTVGTVTVQAAGADHLLVSSDPTFASGVTEIDMSSGNATVDFVDDQYFTFGAEATAPGGVAGNLTAWYKADLGTEAAGSAPTDNSSIDAWRDQSLSDNDAFQNTGSLKPEWLENNGKFNFNPSVTFVPDARLQAQLSTTSWNNNDGSVYVIYNQQTVKTGWRNLVDFGLTTADSNNPQVGMSDNDRIATWMDGFDRDNTTFQPVINDTRLVGYYWQFNVGGHTYTYDGQPYTGATGHKIGTTGIDIGNFANIGGDPQLGEYFPGQIAEIAIYKEQHDAATQAKVQSYFALKYGITLDSNPTNATTNFDYVDSAGTTIWTGNSTNNGYHNDIAGIGRDDAAALNQKQSKSVNSDDIVTISLGAPAVTNAANTNTFIANKSFLLWGNNGQAASYGAAYTPSSFIPAAGYYRMDRVWKVQETGAITNVIVQATGAEHLLVSSDPTFATGVTEIAFSSGSATVDFADGQYFTFGQELTGPGGVATDGLIWVRADMGTNTTADGDQITTWSNLFDGGTMTALGISSVSGVDYAGTAPGNSTYQAVDQNFNPSIAIPNQGGLYQNLGYTDLAQIDWSAFAAAKVTSLPAGAGSLFNNTSPSDLGGEFGELIFLNNNSLWLWTARGGGSSNIVSGVYPNGATIADGTNRLLGVVTKYNGNNGANFYFDGYSGISNATGNQLTRWGKRIYLYRDPDGGRGGTVGNLSEFVAYSRQLTTNEASRINSYLALKYGKTLYAAASTASVSDYLASDSTTIWGATTNTGYNNNITGIGRDDSSALTQKQSKSINSGFQPTIGLGTIAASNAANSSTFAANKSFLVWGDNNGAFTLSAAYNGGSNNRLARVWKVQETGTVDAVTLILPRSALPNDGLRALIVHASDPTFGTVDRTYPLTVSGGNYVATVDFNNGDYFTFSNSSTLPEIDVTPTLIDFGEVNTGSTSPAQAVTMQNLGDVNLSISNISLSGSDAGQFAISSNNCGASVSAGGSCTVQLTFTPTTSGAKSAFLVITSNDSDESTVNVVLMGTTPGGGGSGTLDQYNLAITKSASVANATVGVPFTYTVTVMNKGTIAASNVVMTDQLPASVTFGSANATGGGNCTHNSGTVTCTWASLAGGASATVTISVTP